ncbi:hypothetical protein OSB04_025766 [Centaurea solstitialis]|uniref:D-cysteine desulfhydrase n=1 Tax=Centaurea solstitialis TaxID=347529 RepID=A0AA38SNP4_9ASTR|nr:hypothetical protein OSB04_025766 [Centaurea solstitialis]
MLNILQLNPNPPSLSPFPLHSTTKTLNSLPNRPQFRLLMASTPQSTSDFLTLRPYQHPPWASKLNPIPSHAFSLGHFPTPIHKWNLPNLPKDTEVWLKFQTSSIGTELRSSRVSNFEYWNQVEIESSFELRVLEPSRARAWHSAGLALLNYTPSLYHEELSEGAEKQSDLTQPGLSEFEHTPGWDGFLIYADENFSLRKRDDLSGMQLSGNKVRKLEFLLADAVAQGADCIITIGGIQSNHCRATAVAAKYLNLDCFLILRTSKALVDKDPGLTGNLLVERLVGAHIDLVSKEEYSRIGSLTLTNLLKEKLIKEGRKPYVIPVGGSNSLGTWGYIEAIREIEQQVQKGTTGRSFDDIVVACGSGGTVAGLSIASWLSELKTKVTAFGVCDDPDYFYDYVQGLLDGLEAGINSRDIVKMENAKGLGYAMSTADELKFVKEVAETTGVILDPVYSGKAAYGMMKDMAQNPAKWENRKILFIHTGGLLGLFDKAEELASSVKGWRRMDIDESIPRIDGTGKMF